MHLNAHDVGGLEGCGELDLTERVLSVWEKEVDATFGILVGMKRINVDQLRRQIEALPPAVQAEFSYYGKWAAAMLNQLLTSGALSHADVEVAFGGGGDSSPAQPSFSTGAFVRVRREEVATRVLRPHLRTPGYIHGAVGVVERVCGVFFDPVARAVDGLAEARCALYRVRFKQSALWPEYEGAEDDSIEVEVYEQWLEPATEAELARFNDARGGGVETLQRNPKRARVDDHAHGHDHDHGHDHGHDHVHEERARVEQRAVDEEGSPRAGETMGRAIVSAVLAKELFTREELRAAVQRFERMGAQGEGGRIVARAWVDSAFKARLLADAGAAVAELGICASNNTAPTKLTVVENTPEVHNVVVCTLCSCYPRAILGSSPDWYKSRSYRSRVVREPRTVLREFGLELESGVQVRVHDSTADLRYVVLPLRPEGTEHLTDEEELAKLVSRDALIGTSKI